MLISGPKCKPASECEWNLAAYFGEYLTASTAVWVDPAIPVK